MVNRPVGGYHLVYRDLGVSASGPRHEPEGDFRERLEEAPGGGPAVTSQAVQQWIFFNHRKRGEVEGG